MGPVVQTSSDDAQLPGDERVVASPIAFERALQRAQRDSRSPQRQERGGIRDDHRKKDADRFGKRRCARQTRRERSPRLEHRGSETDRDAQVRDTVGPASESDLQLPQARQRRGVRPVQRLAPRHDRREHAGLLCRSTRVQLLKACNPIGSRRLGGGLDERTLGCVDVARRKRYLRELGEGGGLGGRVVLQLGHAGQQTSDLCRIRPARPAVRQESPRRLQAGRIDVERRPQDPVDIQGAVQGGAVDLGELEEGTEPDALFACRSSQGLQRLDGLCPRPLRHVLSYQRAQRRGMTRSHREHPTQSIDGDDVVCRWERGDARHLVAQLDDHVSGSDPAKRRPEGVEQPVSVAILTANGHQEADRRQSLGVGLEGTLQDLAGSRQPRGPVTEACVG